jgi:membrane protein DedA with SNARE-associated domain
MEHYLIELLQNYGYIIVFVWTLLEGETIVILAGFAAYQGYLELKYIIPLAIAGAVIGDQIFFYIGRFKGTQIIARWPKFAARVEHAHMLTERYHGWIIFASRFMYGFRTIIPISFGMSGVSGKKFLLLNLLGAVVWACVFAGGGYLFGGALESFMGNVKKIEVWIVVAVLSVAASFQLYSWYKRRREGRLIVRDQSLPEDSERDLAK